MTFPMGGFLGREEGSDGERIAHAMEII